MHILINGKPIDITLDTEKTLGDVLSGIDQWISSTGSRMQEVSVNGKTLCVNSLNTEFDRDIIEIKELAIIVSSWRELAIEALSYSLETCIFYEKASFAERNQISSDWEELAAARFLAQDIPDIYNYFRLFLLGKGLSSKDFISLLEERLLEVTDPGSEIIKSGALVENVAKKMEDLPLDIQTGKDIQAAETIQLFSRICEKLFRIFSILRLEGYIPETFLVEDLPALAFIEEFNSALTELSAAYENQDTVLTGDIAEYELAPRLLLFHAALKKLF